MLSWEEIVQNYIIKHFNKISKTTLPLRDHFGINYFTYHKIDHAGKYTVLVDRPNWAEHYVSNQIYLNDPYLRHFSVYKSGICLIESNGSEEYKETVREEGKKVLDIDLGVLLIQKNENSVEFFGFAANKATSALERIYLNHPRLLRSFAIHFKKELGHILTGMQSDASSLVTLKGQDFLCKQPICPDITSSTCLAYYRDLGMKYEVEKAEKLTPRERQCLKLLIQDKSAKETGVILGLSPRTVESYFENIKNKMSTWSKQEILKLSRHFEEMGIL